MPLPHVALHTMMTEEDSTEFKETYTHLNSCQQDLATRWLDLGNNTLLYRYAICMLDQSAVCATMLSLIWRVIWATQDLTE